jgi:hypothetical protein
MYLCYIDESGTPELPGNSSHFVLAGVSVPIWHWKDADRGISSVLAGYGLADAELHTAWMLRPYLEQSRIPNFDNQTRSQRRALVDRYRAGELLRLQQAANSKAYRQAKKNYAHTTAYAHLTHAERQRAVYEIADMVGSWGFARLFAECIDKLYFDPTRTTRSIGEQAFEQVISRFEQYLQKTHESAAGQKNFGLLVHDNNQTVSHKHTEMMRKFHKSGTLWTHVDRIIETPLFVDSRLTRLVQIADLCSYALRRYVERGEAALFQRVFPRADRFKGFAVGVRHWAPQSCTCDICKSHSI